MVVWFVRAGGNGPVEMGWFGRVLAGGSAVVLLVSCALLQVPSDGREDEATVGFGQPDKSGQGHAPEALHVAKDGFNAAAGHAGFDVSRLACST